MMIVIDTDKIIKFIKETPKTFFGLIDIIKIFNDYKENESIKIKSINYFNKYHSNKYFHYFDKKGYMDFILNIFFDASFNVFNKISNSIKFSYFKYKLYKKTVIDKRFKDWFKNLNENDKDQLEKRLSIMEKEFELSPNQYNIDRLYNIVYNEMNDNSLDSLESFGCYSDGKLYSRYYYSTNNHFTANNNSNNNNKDENLQTKSFTISDLVIIRDSLWYINDRMDRVIINDNLLSFALVSKQFFKVLSKILYHEYFEWKKSMIPFNNDSEFSLIKQPPLYFDYNSIRLIPYSSSKEFIKSLFSRVESFYLNSDEQDSRINEGTIRRFKSNSNEIDGEEDNNYRQDIISSRYLVYPPPMPSLQSITIDEYYGYSENYQDLFKHILIDSFKSIKEANNEDSFGIKRFSIGVYNDWNGEPKSEIHFLKPLLEYHSNSLERIIIDCHHIRLKPFNELKSSINNRSKNNIEWTLPVEDLYDSDSDSSKYGDDLTDDESF
ncbi:hypothetical protein ACTFIU_000475 [Dictyostelium citrinum]